MTIERYSFPNGLLPKENIPYELQILNRRDVRQVLPVGKYDLTPDAWTRYDSHTVYHSLNVLENEGDGTAIHRISPKDPSIQLGMRAGDKVEVKPGWHLLDISNKPESMPVLILGPRRGDERIRIYEYVRYVPGSNPQPTAEQQTRMEETIAEPIFSVDEADELIIRKAYDQVQKLPWSSQGKVDLPDIDTFMNWTYLSLRQAGLNFPLNVLNQELSKDKDILKNLPITHKKRSHDVYWKVLTVPSLSPKEATFLKDYVYTKTPEFIAAVNYLDPAETVLEFAKRSSAFIRAGKRTTSYLQLK